MCHQHLIFTSLVLNPLIAGDRNLKVMADNNVQVGILLALHCINKDFSGNMPACVRRCECYLYRQHPAKNTIKSLAQMEPEDRFMQRRFGWLHTMKVPCDWDWKMPFAPANKSTTGYSSQCLKSGNHNAMQLTCNVWFYDTSKQRCPDVQLHSL